MTKSKVIKELEIILKNIEKAYHRSEKLAKELDIPSHGTLQLALEETKEIVKLAKEKK